MKQFDVVASRARGADFAPRLVVLSSHLIDLDLVIIAPLLIDVSAMIHGIDLPIVFRDESYVLAVSELASVPPRGLGQIHGSVADYEDEIRRAIDRLFTGF